MNRDIKVLLAKYGVDQWRVAKELGVAETTLSRWMRVDFTPERRSQVIAAIEKLAGGDEHV